MGDHFVGDNFDDGKMLTDWLIIILLLIDMLIVIIWVIPSPSFVTFDDKRFSL